ncbi:MAG: hypothetical protein K2H67_01550 [Treponemataceae bacterium]|nr:hypothetical protein [Treponemataceae bacterium]
MPRGDSEFVKVTIYVSARFGKILRALATNPSSARAATRIKHFNKEFMLVSDRKLFKSALPLGLASAPFRFRKGLQKFENKIAVSRKH